MIIITRKIHEPNPAGGCRWLVRTETKVFADDDCQGVEGYLNEDVKLYYNISYVEHEIQKI